MAFNPSVINTNMPPPNYPAPPMQFSVLHANSCPTQPVSQQHMFNTGIHVPLANASPSPFTVMPANHLPTPSPPVGLGFVQNPMQTPSTMWNNNSLNPPMVNNQNHHFTSAPIPLAQNTQITAPFQAPLPIPGKQFPAPSWCNSINNTQNDHIGLLSIAPNSSSGNNHRNFNNQASSRPDFQSSAALLNGNLGRNNVSVWSNNNYSNNEPFRPPPPINQLPVNDNQNRFNPNRGSNAFPGENGWNSIQKTNVPDSSIFQNPSAIYGMTANNREALNARVNEVVKNNYQNYNVTNQFPMEQPDMITINQGQKSNWSYDNNTASFSGDSVTNYDKYNRYSNNPKDFNNKHVKKFHQSNDVQNNNFKPKKPNNNQNLIDVRAASNQGNFEGVPSNRKLFQSNNYCRSNSGSTIVEEFTISDSESVESINSKSSPQKQHRNKRIPENLQKIYSESSENNFQNKMVWMTENIQKALQKRNMLFKQARTTNDPAVWDEYNKLKNEINEEIRQAKLDAKNKQNNNNQTANKQRKYNYSSKVWQDKGRKLPFNCDTCDRGFPSQEELSSHTELHIKCDYSGCIFEAHPKIVSLHQRMQHDTGYADVINKLQNDEEIKKWRDERKRRFPTAENILKKKAEQAEKQARGEVIEERDYGQFKKRRFEDRNKDHFANRRDRNNRKRRHRNAFQKAPEIDLAQGSDSEGESEHPTKLPKFRGMKEGFDYLLVNDDVKIDGVAVVKVEDADNNAPVITSKASSNQIISSSDQQDVNELDDDDDAPLEIPIQKVSLNESSDSADEHEDKLFANENQQELDTAVKDTSSATPNAQENSKSNEKSSLPYKDDKGKKRERNEKPCRPPVPPRPRNSLLQMLLSDEIRHERNVIMQCVRHIVRNNFFGIGAKR